MKLDVLCDGIVKIQSHSPLLPDIEHITHDSRKVEHGSLFVAIEGQNYDGNQFISHACQLGALAVLTSKPEMVPCGLPTLVVENPRKTMALLARKLYGFPDRELEITGVTGTNGKTTTAFILDQLLSIKAQAGRLGTLSNYTGVSEETAIRVTPESSEVYQLLRELVSQGCKYAVMEVSSHALVLHRVWGMTLRYVIFNNLTRDHLDFHGTMEAYFKAKQQIFSLLAPRGVAVLNADDTYAAKIEVPNHLVLTFGQGENCDLRFEVIELTSHSSRIRFFYEGHVHDIEMPLLGLHNVYNLASAILVALHEGIEWESIKKVANSLKPATGRMEPVLLGQPFSVLIDFSHSPDALEFVLKSCRSFIKGKIHVVFGAGGNRDKQKRPLLGLAASKFADWLYATSDNPRDEDPDLILEAVTEKIRQDLESGRCLVLPDRKEAIHLALSRAREGDLVLIAGKGHETTQEIKGVFHPFNDRDVVSEILSKRRHDGSF